MRCRYYKRVSARGDLRWLCVFLLYVLFMVFFATVLSIYALVKKAFGR